MNGDRITRVAAIPLALPYTHDGPPTGFGGSIWHTLDYLLVRVDTADGLTGWGEAFGYSVIPATAVAVEHLIAPLTIGRDASNPRELMAELRKTVHMFGRGGPTQFALAGLDIALWDLAGKRQGKSVAQMLCDEFGGTPAARVGSYWSLMRLVEPGIVTQACEKAVRNGYRSIKLHEVTVEAVAAARAAIGSDVQLTLDVNCAWTREEAQQMAARLAPYDLGWLEEPIWPPEDIDGLVELHRQSDIPLAAGENIINAAAFEPYAARGALQYLQPSVTKVGGISEFLDVVRLAQRHRCRLTPHSPYFGPGLLASVQLASAFPGVEGVEIFGVELGAPIFGRTGLPGADGEVAVPSGPGLGADPDPEVIARYRTDRRQAAGNTGVA